MTNWADKWFNEDYAKLYAYHDQAEAENQIDFIIHALQLQGHERVLDMGCGAGRHLLALAKRGYQAVGIDTSSYMLEQAREKLSGVAGIRLVHSDVREFVDPEKFDVALSLFTSFGYADEDEDNLAILKAIAGLLKERGQLFLDYLLPEEVKANLVALEKRDVDGKVVVIEKEIVGDQVIKTIRFPDQTYQERVKLYEKRQIEEMLSKAGFVVEDVWGDYEGNERGGRQLFHCRKMAPIS